MDLLNSESGFQNFLLSSQDETDSTLFNNIRTSSSENQSLDAIKRMNIYLDSYRFRLKESLKKDYPKLYTLVGQESFETLAMQYIKEFPSKYFSIKSFGQNLCDFLKNTAPYSEQPSLFEMAFLEKSMQNILEEQNYQCLDQKALDALPLEQFCDLQLSFHPSIQFLHFHWDVPVLWQEIDQHSKLREPKLYPKPQTWILSRKGLESRLRTIESNELFALEKMRQNMNFAELCDSLCNTLPENAIPAFTVNCLNQWFNDGLISEILLHEK